MIWIREKLLLNNLRGSSSSTKIIAVKLTRGSIWVWFGGDKIDPTINANAPIMRTIYLRVLRC
jgi:hypothetical protein